MNIAREITRGLKVLERACRKPGSDGALTYQTFTWKGSDIRCVPTSGDRSIEIDHRGNPVQITLKLFVRLENWVTFDSTIITMDSEVYTMDNNKPTPVAGGVLTFRGKQYRIITARESSVQSHLELTLADPHSNR